MSQKLDCLDGILGGCASFVVDTGAASGYVSTSYGAISENDKGKQHNVAGYYEFGIADKIEYLSVAVLLPFGFEQYKVSADDEIALYINQIDSGGLKTSVRTPCLYLPSVNYELTLPGVLQDDIVNASDFSIRLKVADFKVSMIGVPEKLNGLTMLAQTWCKIRHNIAMKIPA